MTTRSDLRPLVAVRTWRWLALPIFLLAGCTSAPWSTSMQAPEAPIAVAVPARAAPADEAASPAAAASAATAQSQEHEAETVAAPVPVDPLRPDVGGSWIHVGGLVWLVGSSLGLTWHGVCHILTA